MPELSRSLWHPDVVKNMMLSCNKYHYFSLNAWNSSGSTVMATHTHLQPRYSVLVISHSFIPPRWVSVNEGEVPLLTETHPVTSQLFTVSDKCDGKLEKQKQRPPINIFKHVNNTWHFSFINFVFTVAETRLGRDSDSVMFNFMILHCI